jgi:hypothetical protein
MRLPTCPIVNLLLEYTKTTILSTAFLVMPSSMCYNYLNAADFISIFLMAYAAVLKAILMQLTASAAVSRETTPARAAPVKICRREAYICIKTGRFSG